jgi:hypothetical protein
VYHLCAGMCIACVDVFECMTSMSVYDSKQIGVAPGSCASSAYFLVCKMYIHTHNVLERKRD